MTSLTTKNKFTWIDSLAPVFLVLAILNSTYYLPERSEVYRLWMNLALGFVGYFAILYRINKSPLSNVNYITAIILRLIPLFSLPLLSDDIYRFIWDGAQILHGINPFSYTPEQLISFHYNWVDMGLFQKMNSPAYFSVYPPINQLAFTLSALPGKENFLASVIILRLFILAFDIGNIYLIKKLLAHFKKNENLVYLYALNPLVIIEFTGNLHFEAVMIFFTLLAIYLLFKNKWIWAAIVLGLAICSKLLPLIFLPLFIHHIGWKKSFYAGLICALTVLLLFSPFLYNVELLNHFFNSLQLYYGKFEFNGSIYQILKALGWKLLGYNPIAYTSKILLIFTLIGFIITYFKSKNIFDGIFWLMFIYLLFGAIVHPWYMLILVAFSPFIQWRFAIVWSVLICLSYYTYHVTPYQESLILVFIEYVFLSLYMLYEFSNRKNLSKNF